MNNDKYWQPLTPYELNKFKDETFEEILIILDKKNAYDVIGGKENDSVEVLQQKAIDLKDKYKSANNDINKAANKIRIIFKDDASKASYDEYLSKKHRLRLFEDIDSRYSSMGVITYDATVDFAESLANLVGLSSEDCVSIIQDYCKEKKYKIETKRVLYATTRDKLWKYFDRAIYIGAIALLAFAYFFIINADDKKDSIVTYSQISKDEAQLNDELGVMEFIDQYNASIGNNTRLRLSPPELGTSNEHDTYWYKSNLSDTASGVGIYTNKNGLLTRIVIYLPVGYNQSEASTLCSSMLRLLTNNRVDNGLLLAASNGVRWSSADLSLTNLTPYLRAYYLMLRNKNYTVCLRSIVNNRDYVVQNTDSYLRDKKSVKVEISARGINNEK